MFPLIDVVSNIGSRFVEVLIVIPAYTVTNDLIHNYNSHIVNDYSDQKGNKEMPYILKYKSHCGFLFLHYSSCKFIYNIPKSGYTISLIITIFRKSHFLKGKIEIVFIIQHSMIMTNIDNASTCNICFMVTKVTQVTVIYISVPCCKI